MLKVDYKKALGPLYKTSAKQVIEVDVPPMNFLMIDGKGKPGAPNYIEAVEALFSTAYTIKFMVKKSDRGLNYGVMPLEGLWWADDWSDFINDNRENWQWTMMIMQPEPVTAALVEEALDRVQQKKELSAVEKLRFESFREGKSAQILHIGPFSEEGPTIQKMHDWIIESGSHMRDKHHEIYLSDIRRAAPEKWKTILRQPML